MGFVDFMSSTAGRVLRIVAGLALIPIGLLTVTGPVGVGLAVFGLVAISAGALNFCLFAPLFGQPFKPKLHTGH